MVWEDEIKGEVVCSRSCLQRIVEVQELCKAMPLEASRHCSAIEPKATAAHYPLQAGHSGYSQGATGIADNREARVRRVRLMAHTKAMADGPMREHRMVFSCVDRFRDQLAAWRKSD